MDRRVKTSNVGQGRAHHEAIIRGWVSSTRAGSTGITVLDGSTTADGITSITVIGGTVTDNGDGTVVITIAGGGGGSGGSGTGNTDTVISIVTASGSAQTLDVSAAGIFDITLTANCTFTFVGATAAVTQIQVILRQGGSGSYTATWPASVVWMDSATGLAGGSAPTLFTAVGSQSNFNFVSLDAGVTWGGKMTNEEGSTVAALDDLSDVTITSPANANRLRYDGSTWANSNLVWEPLIATDGTVVTDGLLNPVQHEVPY